MADLQFSTEVGRAEALLRAADALLRTLGPSQATLLVPVSVAQENADLGLAPPLVEQITLSPCVVRVLSSPGAARTRAELLLSASTVNAAAEAHAMDPPSALFDSALGILHSGKLLRIESVGWDSFADTPYLYRVVLTD